MGLTSALRHQACLGATFMLMLDCLAATPMLMLNHRNSKRFGCCSRGVLTVVLNASSQQFSRMTFVTWS
jgi:hypothetical protein